MNQIINDSKQNSIGPQKQCPNNPQKKNLEKKVISGALAGVLLFSGAIAFENHHSAKTTYDPIKHPIAEIEAYERETLYNLLDKYNLTNYKENINGTRNYYYTASNYEKINELDETYLYSFYLNTDEITFNAVLNSLGYSDLDDFLKKNEYLDEENNPSIKVWRKHDKQYAINQIEANERKQK